MAPKQLKAFNNFSRYLLLSGPRLTGKSLASCHKILRHAVDCPKGRIAMFSKRIKTAKEGGIWTDLIEVVFPMWEQRGITKFLTPPKQDGQTRTLFCVVANRYGGGTPIYLNSLDVDADVENSLKERRFSMIYFSELSKFKSRKIFDISIASLRIPGLPHEQHQWLADTNPSDEGMRSWIYQLFWGERLAKGFPDYVVTEQQKRAFTDRQKQLDVIEIMLHDNPFLTQDQIDEVVSTYGHDPSMYARYVLGKWDTASADGFFQDVFREELHVVGDCSNIEPRRWEVLLPDTNRADWYTSWDIGDRWTSVVFIARERDPIGNNFYSVCDEVSVEGERIRLEDLVSAVMRKMEKWEKYAGKPIRWMHFADNSSWNFKIAAQATEEILVQQISGGKIRLIAAEKYRGAAMDGVDTLKRLMFEGRFFVSAHCFSVIRMLKGLAPKTARSGFVTVPDGPLSHPFDALRYAIQQLEARTVLKKSMPTSGFVRPRIIAMA